MYISILQQYVAHGWPSMIGTSQTMMFCVRETCFHHSGHASHMLRRHMGCLAPCLQSPSKFCDSMGHALRRNPRATTTEKHMRYTYPKNSIVCRIICVCFTYEYEKNIYIYISTLYLHIIEANIILSFAHSCCSCPPSINKPLVDLIWRILISNCKQLQACQLLWETQNGDDSWKCIVHPLPRKWLIFNDIHNDAQPSLPCHWVMNMENSWEIPRLKNLSLGGFPMLNLISARTVVWSRSIDSWLQFV